MIDNDIRECKICSMEGAGPESTIFRDTYWAAGIGPGMDVPGWIVLRTVRHAELITGLDDAEAETLGGHARHLAAAIAEATGAPLVYQMAFGENHPHYHVLFTARTAETPADRRSGNILQLMADGAVDPDGARALVPAIRAAYERLSCSAGVPSVDR